MKDGRITGVLKNWSRWLGGSARTGLSDEIKRQIPERLGPHGIGTISIIVDLRASRVAIAAAILIGLTILGGVVGNRGGVAQMYRDGKLLLRYAIGGEDACRAETVSSLSRLRDSLMAQGHEVVYYGDRRGSKGNEKAILMQWKTTDQNYVVILRDFSAQTVNAKDLIRLQARMLENKSE
jgi:hypothetical protein